MEIRDSNLSFVFPDTQDFGQRHNLL